MSSSEPSRLEQALERGLLPGGHISQELGALGDYPLETVEDAQAVVAALRRYADQSRQALKSGEETVASALHPLASLFQDAETDEAYVVLEAEGLPLLLEIFDQRLPLAVADEGEDLIFVLKIFVVYGYEPGMQRIVQALRQPLDHNLFVWGVLFETVHDEHPNRQLICDQLRDPLPTGFAGVAYLDLVNRLAGHGEALPHPFDTAAGMSLLREWATSDRAEEASYAQSVAHAIPFLTRTERDEILQILLKHEDQLVVVDAAAAAGRLGLAEGFHKLAELCADASVSYFACQYLRELGREELIPETARNPHFQAVAEFCAWLTLPDAYGEIPDEVEIVDHRVINWPPTQDLRPLWLIKYTYAADPNDPEDYPESGIGLVGSETGVLFDETTLDQTPEEVYALHCCWELQQQGDECAPEELSIAAGMKLLGWAP